MTDTKLLRRQKTTSVESGKILVNRSVLRSGKIVSEEEVQEKLAVNKFETDPAYVRVALGKTCNLGQYESFRIDIAITAPCYVEEILAVQKSTSSLVSDLLADELKLYLGDRFVEEENGSEQS